MASGLQCGVIGLTDPSSAPAASAVSPNVRVRTASGYVATVADIVQFSGATVLGNWVVPAVRCTAGSIPVIHSACSGIAYAPSISGLSPAGPMQMQSPDARAKGT